MIGYKAFNKDLTCRGFQYEIGKTYSIEGLPILCEKGFHFCKNIKDTYRYYPMRESIRICKVEAIGEIVTDDNVKYCTNKIKILEEITDDCERKCNSDLSNTGYCNAGDHNTGNYNSGDYNSGNSNSGDFNSGDHNLGDCNSGSSNSGDYNSGSQNSGSFNSGYCNSGNYNSGCKNSGNYNSGYRNSGNHNSGYWNFGDYSSGIFNTEENPKIKMFDKESDWTIKDWKSSEAYRIMMTCPYTSSYSVPKSVMTEEEKENYPGYETTGGCTKTVVATKEDKEKWWNDLAESDKEIIRALPNFDFDKFRQCVGF